MSKSIIISERDNIAAVSENGRVLEFFIHRGDILLGDIYLARVENILPSIDAAFVNVGSDKMGFLHASDITGKGALKDKLKPKQNVIIQVVKEPTGHKGPRVTMAVSLPGRFLVLMPNEKGVNVSKKISSSKERARLKSIVSLLKPAGVGVIIRTEAENQSESEIQEDLEFLLEKWNSIVTTSDTITPPNLLYRDQDLLYRVIREACTEDISDITLDTTFGYHRTTQLIQSWNISHPINISVHKGTDALLVNKGIDKEIRNALQTKVLLPSGGYLYIQTTEALSVIDVNSGKFTSSATQGETIRKTNLEAVDEIARQLRLRNIGGMIIVDFIDMENRVDQLSVLEQFELALEPDKSKPQIGQLSDLGLVELTRHRQGQSLAEIFTKKCPACNGNGAVIEDFNFSATPQEGEQIVKTSKLKFTKPINNKHALQVNDARKATHSTVQNRIAHSATKKIETSPTMAASSEINKQPQAEQRETFILNSEIINKFFSESAFVPNASKVVRYYAIPSGVARNYLGKNFTPDVFTILQELESMGSSPAPQPHQQAQPVQHNHMQRQHGHRPMPQQQHQVKPQQQQPMQQQPQQPMQQPQYQQPIQQPVQQPQVIQPQQQIQPQEQPVQQPQVIQPPQPQQQIQQPQAIQPQPPQEQIQPQEVVPVPQNIEPQESVEVQEEIQQSPEQEQQQPEEQQEVKKPVGRRPVRTDGKQSGPRGRYPKRNQPKPENQ